jgi:AcrR family transcriptional regulator
MNVVGLRDRKKERTRDELVEVALDLFRAQGFDGTTIEQIASAADVSPRTFFRYFATKEDVLFGDPIGVAEQRSATLMADLRARPAGNTPGSVLCVALLTLSAGYQDELPTLLVRKQIIAATPSLQSRALERRRSWEQSVVDELRSRFPQSYSALDLRVTVAAVIAALHAALDVWLETDGLTDLTDLIRRAFDHLSTGLDIAAS